MRPKGPVWFRVERPRWGWFGLFYLLFFCQADSLFSEDDLTSGQAGKKNWQKAEKNHNQISVNLRRSPVI